MKITTSTVIKALCLVFITGFAQNVFAQAKDPCQTCSCQSLFCSCQSGKCCKPNTPTCNCTIFICHCSCAGSAIVLPDVEFIQLGEFARFLRSNEFSSQASTNLANGVDQLIAAATATNASLYYEIGGNLEQLVRTLPSGEKQKANTWIQTRGGTSLIE